MRAILTLENGERATIPVVLQTSRSKKFIFIDSLEDDVLKQYNRTNKIKAVKIHLLRN